MNPYYQNPFTSNPFLMMMMGMGNQDMNPYEGNGLLHPVYITPLMMHSLQRSVPEWKDPALDNAKEGNMDCIKGATVSCTDSGQKTRTIDPKTGAIILKELQIPEKISCFAGCAQFNPCNNNLYSSFIKSEHSCDTSAYFYYTCESFEEMAPFVSDCAQHDDGAKIDAPITTISGASKYKIWEKLVMHNREEGKGREIMYDDDSVEPGMGMSVGGGNAGNAPITDEELGNVLDKKYKTDYKARIQPFYNDIVYEDNMQNLNMDVMENGNLKVYNNHHDTLELIIVSVWGVLFSVLFLCFCCIIAGFCGFVAREIRKKMRKNNVDKRGGDRQDIRYIDMSDRSGSDNNSKIFRSQLDHDLL